MKNFEKYLDEARNKSITLDSRQVKEIINNIKDVIENIEENYVDMNDANMLNRVLEILKEGNI